MKKLFLFFLILPWINNSIAQSGDGGGGGGYEENIEYNLQTINKPIEKEFTTEFKNRYDKDNLPELKDFIDRKKNELNVFKNNLLVNETNLQSKKRLKLALDAIAVLKNNKTFADSLNKPVKSSYRIIPENVRNVIRAYVSYDDTNITVNQLNERLSGFYSDMGGSLKQDSLLRESIKNIQHDVTDAQEHVQSVFNVNNDLNNTKLLISGLFVLLMAMILVLFFLPLVRDKEKELTTIFLKGSGLQYVTIFCLIISIVLFGVLGVLEGKELAAIISGISGFILGKETQNKSQPLTDPARPE